MTYEEALETWARKHCPYLPGSIVEMRLSVDQADAELFLQYTTSDGATHQSAETFGWDSNEVVREIVNTALGVIE